MLPLAAVCLAAVVPATASASRATVKVGTTSAGSVLVDQHSRSLYMFARDHRGKSACSGACAQNWPPLLTTGKPKASSGVSARKLDTIKRKDGRTQVTYAGHPLYRFAADGAPGDVNGQGLTEFGGLWSLLAPSGSRITSAPGSQPVPTPSPSPSPGYPPY